MEKSVKKILILPFIALLSVYRLLISPFFANTCRYQPTCSEYAKDAFRLHGVIKGAYLTTHRLLRCHPWGGSGYNPVPSPEQTEGAVQSGDALPDKRVNTLVDHQQHENGCALERNINKSSVK